MKHTEEKAIRLVIENRVSVTWVNDARDAAQGVIDGDTDTYHASYSPVGKVCSCPAGANHRVCSHAIALELAVNAHALSRA